MKRFPLFLLAGLVGIMSFVMWRHAHPPAVPVTEQDAIAQANALLQQGHWKHALRVVNGAIDDNPRSRALHLEHARLLMVLGAFRAAADEYQQWAPPPADDPVSALRLAHCLQLTEQFEAEEKVLLKLQQAHPRLQGLGVNLAEVYLLKATSETDPQARRRLTDKALPLLGNYEYERCVRASVMLDRGDPAAALQAMDLAHPPDFRINASQGSLQQAGEIAQFNSALASIYMQLGDVEKGKAAMAKAAVGADSGLRDAMKSGPSPGPRELLAPFLVQTTDGTPVLHSYALLIPILLSGRVWNGQPLPMEEVRWWAERLLALKPDGLNVSASDQAAAESVAAMAAALDAGDYKGAIAHIDRLSASLQHGAADCAPWEFINKGTALGTLQLMAGDIARRAGDAAEAEVRYRAALQQPSVAPLARERLGAK